MIADRSGPGENANGFLYRVVLRDTFPTDSGLNAVLRPIQIDDPGPFVSGTVTGRLRFDASALWAQGLRPEGDEDAPFRFLTAPAALTRDDLEWACQHLVVEVDAPRSSADLTDPGVAERHLLDRMTSDVGAEAFPNLDRSAVDVAASIISTARAARQGRLVVTFEELLRRANLRSDFGAVARLHPVDRSLEVERSTAAQQIIEAAAEISDVGGYLLITGPPGQGKSWICQQVLDAMQEAGWLTAEHYCYLGDADGERNERVLSETVFGSVISRLSSAEPSLLLDQRPRFAADEEALERFLLRAVEKSPQRKVALFVDGVDHVTRVRSRMGDRFDPSKSLVESIAALNLPPGVVLVVLSQPGGHLQPLNDENTRSIPVPGLSAPELRQLASHLGVVPGDDPADPARPPLLEDSDAVQEFLGELEQRSSGNALYATYLCRETLRRSDSMINAAQTVRDLPAFDGTLENYYQHLYNALGGGASWVADVVALVNFSLTRVDLREVRPDGAHHVDSALDLLAPVLTERAAQGGVRVYHESFARYLRRSFENERPAMTALLARIAQWLEGKGLFDDPRSFRSLLPILAASGDDRRIVDLVDRCFSSKAVAAGYPASAIAANLAIAAGAATRLGDWAAAVRCVELARAAQACEYERFDSLLVAFADVPAELMGAERLASRLLTDDSLAMPARDGVQMCAAVDRLGASAPWSRYIEGFEREALKDNTHYGEASVEAVHLALFRGKLRVASFIHEETGRAFPRPAPHEGTVQSTATQTNAIDWIRAAAWIERRNLPTAQAVDAVFDTFGAQGLRRLLHALKHPGDAYLVCAEKLARSPRARARSLTAHALAQKAIKHGVQTGSIRRLLDLGVDPHTFVNKNENAFGEKLLSLTREVQESSIESDVVTLEAWLDQIALASYLDPEILLQAHILIVGEGWYRCWLRFAVALARAEAVDEGRDSMIMDAFKHLIGDLRPFSGDPRACDLYRTLPLIREMITRAIRLLADPHWEEALAILNKIRDSTTTSFRGAVGGPVTPDYLLRLAIETASPSRYPVAETLIGGEIAEGAASRYYSDLAEYRLLAARLAIKAGDIDRATSLWEEACALLTSYGYHKDITVYGVLDALPSLITADPKRGRSCVSAVQGLCERVPLHTDGKSTRGTWSTWWQLLAQADPVDATELVVPELLGRCNDPRELLDGVLGNVWQEWFAEVDPFLSGALRLTLEEPLNPRDSVLLQRISDAPMCEEPAKRDLMTWLMARADERHVSYSVSNSDDLLAKDDVLVAELNAVATRSGVPAVGSLAQRQITLSENSAYQPRPRRVTVDAQGEDIHHLFPDGMPGLSRAIRAWRRRPYDAQSAAWSVDRFANVIGYRLLQLAASGRLEEAESALRALGQGVSLGAPAEILRAIGEGLERHGANRLAAVSLALTWTRTRGGGGWLTFGGRTELESLKRASRLDRDAALAVVAEEVEHAIASSYGPYGITQALITGFSSGALLVSGLESVDVAFAVWDEALAVISARAPRVADSDDPDHPYSPSQPDSAAKVPGDLEAAFALATVGGLFHPSRERKRRTLLALGLLIEHRPSVMVEAINRALSSLSDPATLSWLLATLASAENDGETVVIASQAALGELSTRSLLTIRALARRLVRGESPPLVASSVPDAALLPDGMQLISLSTEDADPDPSQKTMFVDFIDSVAGARLDRAEGLLPGLGIAVQKRAISSLDSEIVQKRLRSQLDCLASQVRKRWPDAYLVNEETVEETIQAVAAGGRAALLAAGQFAYDGVAWEDALASALLDDPEIPLQLEATRQPRPAVAAPPTSGDKIWSSIRDRARGASQIETGFQAGGEEQGMIFGTVSLKEAAKLESIAQGTFADWRWLGFAERRIVEPVGWREGKELTAFRYCAMEVRGPGDQEALLIPPFTSGDLRLWKAVVKMEHGALLFARSQPLLGIDRNLRLAADSKQGLGLPPFILTPSPTILAALTLRPGERFCYRDPSGPGLALVTWRADYDRNEYQLTHQRIWDRDPS